MANLVLEIYDNAGRPVVSREHNGAGQAELGDGDPRAAGYTFHLQAMHVGRCDLPGLSSCRNLGNRDGDLGRGRLSGNKLGALAQPHGHHEQTPLRAKNRGPHFGMGGGNPGRILRAGQQRLQHAQLLVKQSQRQQAVAPLMAVRQEAIRPKAQATAAGRQGDIREQADLLRLGTDWFVEA